MEQPARPSRSCVHVAQIYTPIKQPELYLLLTLGFDLEASESLLVRAGNNSQSTSRNMAVCHESRFETQGFGAWSREREVRARAE